MMYLDRNRVESLSRLMAALAEPMRERDVRQSIGQHVLQLLNAQFYASYVWSPEAAMFQQASSINMDPANLREYERYFQFHDPITPAMQRHRTAVRATDVLSHERLKCTPFFGDFLDRDGLYWGVNLYAWDGERNIGDMRIWRGRRGENFSDDDLALLNLVLPAFVTALRRCSRPDAKLGAQQNHGTPLSPREMDIARLIACGMSDKEIAKRLGVSVATVRTHIQHAYNKLGVDNRIKLVQLLHL